MIKMENTPIKDYVVDWIDNLSTSDLHFEFREINICKLSESVIFNIRKENIPNNLTFEDLQIKLYKMLKPTNIFHKYFKLLCESLNVDNEINTQIKNIVMTNVLEHPKTSIGAIYKLIDYDIRKNNLTDFTLFSNDKSKSFLCLKAFLRTIPYFDMMFNDIQQDDNFVVIDDFDLTVSLIKILYDPKIIDLYIDKYVELFELMDKYLMKDQFYIMINFGFKNIESIINKLINDNNFDTIKLLYRILVNILNIVPVNNIDREICLGANAIINKICRKDMGEHIIYFDNWQNAFEDKYKLKAIYITQKYELLDIANIEPRVVIRFLSVLNFPNDDYNDIFDTMEQEGASLKFDPNDFEHSCQIIIINSYYPKLKYTKLIKSPIVILDMKENWVDIRIGKSKSNLNIKIGSNLIFGYWNARLNNEKFTYRRVESILKYINNEISANVNKAIYLSVYSGVCSKYKLFLDRTCDDICKSDIYLLEHCQI